MLVDTQKKNWPTRLATVSTALMFWAVVDAANAHHSFNMFDMQSTITLEGRVIDFDYINPHGWVVVETTNERGETVTWEVETISALVMRRRGIERESLEAGDWVSIDAHPARNAARLIANGEVIRKLDGRKLVVGFQGGNPDLEVDKPTEGAVATSLAGTWRGDSHLIDVVDPLALTMWPLTDKGRMALEAYDGSQNPYVDCVPYSPPVQMLAPLTMTIDVADEAVRLIMGLAGEDRVVYLDGRGRPDNQPPTNAGHSIGHWEGNELVIETANFTARELGLAFGVPSSTAKRLTERLALSEDGTQIVYQFEVVDPEYLTAPVTGENRFHYRPELSLEDYSCDRESARRFLEVF